MIGILECDGEWVAENRRGFLKADTMLPEVERGLLSIPLEFHPSIVGARGNGGNAPGSTLDAYVTLGYLDA